MGKIIILYAVFIYISSVNPNKEILKSKNPLPYFRRQVEEIADDIPVKMVTEDSRGKLLSLLVKNVKELFNDDNDESELNQDANVIVTTSEILKPTMLELAADDLVNIDRAPKMHKLRAKDLVTVEHTNDVMLYENLSVTTIDREFEFENFNKIEKTESTSEKRMKEIAREMKYFEKFDNAIKEVTPLLTSISSYVLEATDSMDVVKQEDYNKTCISCNNVLNENCINPKNKIVPSVTCQRESDLCYSTHTPFGIIDRGCFNVNHNLTTYVCSCNLCNYISISEMPYIFSNKQSWIDNVVELSRTRNFRNSIFKDMSCLRCEVNTTIKTGDMVDSENCLEGNIAYLPIQDCHDHEICGVKAVRSDGYIWRGCITAPLYNYWWSFCEHDLCNHDLLVSVYDFNIHV